jgi:methyltransferase family protein
VIDISSGDARLDTFLANGYWRIRGMSSRFAAAICGHVIRRQTALGISGDIVEIGAFEGRFFVAMALLLQAHEHGLGIDVFTWPNSGVYDRFLENCAAAGLSKDSYTAWKADACALSPADLRRKLRSGAVRFMHVDGEHTAERLAHDLELTHAVLHPDGIIALDDMLHPGYPTLIVTVLHYLARHPEMRVLSIIDRESITAAAKFLICRADRAACYEQNLMSSFAAFHYPLGATIAGHLTLVLTPHPTFPRID